MISPGITRYFIPTLILFHFTGLSLFLFYAEASGLTWMNLTLCGLLVYLTEPKNTQSFFTFMFIFLGGFFIELIGVKTGLLFGDYAYGTVLGWRFLDVSVVIGVNWYTIVLASSNIARNVNGGIWGQSILAGILSTIMDIIIEPVAIKYEFWSWDGESIPVYNYVTWFVFGTLFSYVYLRLSKRKNETAVWLYLIWLIFFIVLSVA